MKRVSLTGVAVLSGCISMFAQVPGTAGGPPPRGFGAHGPGPIGMEMHAGKIVIGRSLFG